MGDCETLGIVAELRYVAWVNLGITATIDMEIRVTRVVLVVPFRPELVNASHLTKERTNLSSRVRSN